MGRLIRALDALTNILVVVSGVAITLMAVHIAADVGRVGTDHLPVGDPAEPLVGEQERHHLLARHDVPHGAHPGRQQRRKGKQRRAANPANRRP